MGLVGVPYYLGALALRGSAEDLLARSRGEHARAEEVRGTPDSHPYPAACVGLHQLLGHSGADCTFAGVGGVGQILGERAAVCGTVHVEVLHRYELRPGGCGTLDHPRLQWWKQLGPLVVGWVEGEVDDRSPRAGLSGEVGVRGVASCDLDALVHPRPAAAVDHPDSPAPLDQLVCHRQTHGPGAEDDVKLAVVGHPLFLLSLVAPVP